MPSGAETRAGTTRLAHDAWRELLLAATEFMRRFEVAGDFGDLTSREYDVLRALAEAGRFPGAQGSGGDGAQLGVGEPSGVGETVTAGERSEAREAVAASASPEEPVGLRLGVLAEATYLPQPSMSRLVERLEKRGLVQRTACAGDGRGTLVSLTDAGVHRQREVGRRHVRSIVSAMTAGLPPDDLAQLGELLHRLRAGADGAASPN